MPKNLQSIISYYHDCYKSDNREQLIFDFLNEKVENKICIENKEELLNKEYPRIPVDSKKATAILRKLELYHKEKELIYASFFIGGYYLDFKGDQKRLCAPLFYYSAEITQDDEFHYLTLDHNTQQINYPLLHLLSDNNGEVIFDDPLFKALPQQTIDFGDINSIVSFIKKHFNDLDYQNIYAYPKNCKLSQLKRKLTSLEKDNTQQRTLYTTSIVGLISKSPNTRGVLNELKELAEQKAFSTPLNELFKVPHKSPKRTYKEGFIPILLSDAQEAILKSSSSNPLTLIVGPPGTGKTYTIGAIALEHMSRGESVLIASRTNEAVDVIVEKISKQVGFERCIVRSGKKREYSTSLNRFLKALTTRVHPINYLIKEFSFSEKFSLINLQGKLKVYVKTISKLHQELNKIEREILSEIENEIEWGKHLSHDNKTLFQKIKTQYLSFRNKAQTPLWESYTNLSNTDDKLVNNILEAIKTNYTLQILSTLSTNWNDIKMFREALMLSSDTEKLKKFNEINFNAVLKAFPIWTSNLSELKDALPYTEELFDVVIIDEATQCDIASCLPLMQRAKRVVFAGDPHQLRHISFLSSGIQNQLQQKHSLQNEEKSILNYRDNSILDIASIALTSSDQVAMLDEHFRSLSPIIEFSNKHFYDNALKIMTSRPDEKEQALYFIYCNGIRSKNGTNEIEANKLLKAIKTLIKEELSLDKNKSTTIGILSPFRAQVDLLSSIVLNEISTESIHKHSIRVGTAYSFQGEERDNMYLSFALDNKSHHGSFHHLNKEDVFNVAITRARKKQFVYISVKESEIKKGSLLHKYLTYSTTKIKTHKDVKDQFLKETSTYLKLLNINNQWPDYIIAGQTIDLLIKQNNTYIGIDLIGYPGEFATALGINRTRMLNRAGINIFPLTYSNWYFEPEKTKNALKTFLEPFNKTL